MFDLGNTYTRTQIHEKLGGGNRQMGIIWAKRSYEDVVLVHNPKSCELYGYEDGRKADGIWEYTGQGMSGDQDEKSIPNRLLLDPGNIKHLFHCGKSGHKYLGMFRCTGWKRYRPSSGKRAGDSLIQATLVEV